MSLVKLTIPLALSAVVWSGYVMFDMYNYHWSLKQIKSDDK